MSRATPSDYGTPEGDARLTAGRRARIAKNRRPVQELKDQHVFRPIIRGVRERIVPLLDPPPGAYGEIHTAEMHRQKPYIEMMRLTETFEAWVQLQKVSALTLYSPRFLEPQPED